ncbi:MAG: type II secretion system F family protein [Candidatus Nezhaarchaeota archaeon]|nr:type II secretion system F family protein [Candidatus Nezhaarchaeota archaeon]MCX8142191.1 type II secretion system F family protein [Candidatus Nezhaarchaeota archaeon]MDW8050026.1 type II secretion system F family protein [Nitrososphaerota archaeon]
MASLTGTAYQNFWWLSNALMKLLYRGRPSKLRDTLEAAGIKVHPEAYLSVVGLFFLMSVVASAIIAWLTGLLPVLVTPMVVLLIGYIIPSIKAQDRAAKLDMEAPFMAAYVSVMATGGLSPYSSLRRLGKCELLPHTSKVAREIELDVQLKGMAPIAAMERSAERVPSREYRDFLMGYISTLRAGGDVIHYLLTRTETMFRDLAAKIRIFGERAAILLESYVAVLILGTLGISVLYLVSIAFQGIWQLGFTVGNFLLYSYILVPVISVIFIYLSEMSSFQEPVYETAPYKVFAASLPIMIFLMLITILPYLMPELSLMPLIREFKNFLSHLRALLNLERGLEPAIGMSLVLILGTIPSAIAHSYYSRRRGSKIVKEVTNFLRDLTEVRKTGASPEACITQLSSRPYGVFSKYLSVVARQIRWGQPIRVIYESLKRKISSWLALINLYLLVDAIEVGGGSPETLETLTRFGEMQASLEKEKMAALRPLIIMPYMGAAIMIFSTLIMVSFMRSASMAIARSPMQFIQILTVIVPALVFQSYLMGLVTGKISAGCTSAGFMHAIMLTLIALLSIILVQYIGLILFL